MKPSPHEDQKLVDFLKTYQASPPPPSANLEESLMSHLASEPQGKVLPKSRKRWLMPSLLTAGFLLLWGTLRWLSPSPQLTQTITDEELEAFLLDGWYGAMGETSYAQSQSDFEAKWSLLSYHDSGSESPN